MGSGPRYRWVVLVVGTAAQAATAYFLGLAAVTPALREHFGLGLAGVGVLIGLASAGLIPTLMAWGGAADRFGERWVMASGLLGAAVALGFLALVDNAVAAGALLVVAGASGASVNAASGRAVLTWFPATGRGTAMAIRQTAVPVGAAVAAVALPPIADAGGVPAVFAALAVTCLAAAVAVAAFIREPPGRPARSARAAARARDVLADRRLQRLSLAGLLLVVPQFLGSVFLVEVLHGGAGLSLPVAGALLGLTHVLGAIGRLANGAWSTGCTAGSARCGSWPSRWPSASRWPPSCGRARRLCWPRRSSRPPRSRSAGTGSCSPRPGSWPLRAAPPPRWPCPTPPTTWPPPSHPPSAGSWPTSRAGRRC